MDGVDHELERRIDDGAAMKSGPLLAFFADGAEGFASAAAHSPQKSSPGSFEAPHCGHDRASGAAHFAQNLRPSRLSALHFEQRMFPLRFGLYLLNSSSSALASFRSAVWKPSVNQL